MRNISSSFKDGDDRKKKALDHAYNIAMRRIQAQPSKHYELAKKVLSWVVFAKQHLTPLQLQIAVAVEVGSQTLEKDNMADIGLSISVCAGLVVIDKESNVIRPVHYTTQEFFQRSWKEWFPDSHVYLTRVCITYISLEDFDSGECSSSEALEARLKDYPLYQYAGQNWGFHAKDALMEEDPLVLGLLRSTKILPAYTQTFTTRWRIDYGEPTGMTGLHVAAHFGLPNSMVVLLRTSPEINLRDRIERQTPLLWAGHRKDITKLLLDSGADMELPNRLDFTALMNAVDRGCEHVVRLLIDRGANINYKTLEGRTALTIAINSGNENVVRLLLDKGANVQSTFYSGMTPLYLAVCSGQEDLVRLLMERGADVNSKNHSGTTPLFAAIELDLKRIVKLLLASGADVNSKKRDGKTPLSHAMVHGDESLVRLLLLHAPDIESSGSIYDLLSLAIQNGKKDVVKLLLGKTPDINARKRELISVAAEHGNCDIVSMLLEGMASIKLHHYSGQTPLSKATENGHEGVVELLLDAGADIESTTRYNDTWSLNSSGVFEMRTSHCQTSLSLAARNGRGGVVRLLLDKNADIESKRDFGFSPLCLAALNGHEFVAKLLLDKGAQIESRTNSSQTPLILAASQPFEGVVNLLLERGARIETKDMQGFTPIIIAARHGYVAVVKLLLQHQARIDAKGRRGETALLEAIAGQHEDVVQLLLESQASVKMKGLKYMLSPLQLALRKRHQGILSLVQDKLAELSSGSEVCSESEPEGPNCILDSDGNTTSSLLLEEQAGSQLPSQRNGSSRRRANSETETHVSDSDIDAEYEGKGTNTCHDSITPSSQNQGPEIVPSRSDSGPNRTQVSLETHSSSRHRPQRRHRAEPRKVGRSKRVESEPEPETSLAEPTREVRSSRKRTSRSKMTGQAQSRSQPRKVFGFLGIF